MADPDSQVWLNTSRTGHRMALIDMQTIAARIGLARQKLSTQVSVYNAYLCIRVTITVYINGTESSLIF